MFRPVLVVTVLVLVGSGGTGVGAAVVKRPNLIVMKTATVPDGAAPGSRFEVTFRVRNVGSRTARRAHADLVLSDDRRRDADDLVALRVGTQERTPGTVQRLTRTARMPAAALPGTHVLLACADSRNAVRESDERDNCRVLDDAFVVHGGT